MGENLYQTLDRCGLDFNASTYEEFIQFIITGAPAHFEEAAEILTGIFEPITLPEEVIDTESASRQKSVRKMRKAALLTLQKRLRGKILH